MVKEIAMSKNRKQFTRRDMLKLSAAGGAATLFGKAWGQTCIDQTPVEIDTVAFTGCGVGGEPFPTSPFIMQPYTQPLPIPRALRPGWRRQDGTLDPNAKDAWTVRVKNGARTATISRPGPGHGDQDALGERPANNGARFGLPPAGTHQLWTSGAGTNGLDLHFPDPILYHIRLQVSSHKFTTSPVVNIDDNGNAVSLPAGATGVAPAGSATFKGVSVPAFFTPGSTIYGFNGTFPGPMVNIEYDGHPALVRFENDLDKNPLCRDRQDFGAPDWAFLTHLHNGHTAPESDGNPNHLVDHEGGYQPGEWSDNLYLGYPAGGLDAEKQSFLWFHDHRMHHTGPNVYKGLVGLAPHYDPKIDNGDETRGLRLPGVRINNGDGTFDVDFDIPMAFYDASLDDGVTSHQDEHTNPNPAICGAVHPEWWGQLFHKHYPNHGFVGDVFTINGVAFPTLVVKRRKYRFRWLDASVARQYDLSFRQGTPMPFPGQQGQWNFGAVDTRGRTTAVQGTTVMLMTQIATEGGLLPTPITRDSIQIWPAKRREVIVDFSKYRDGSPTRSGDVVYLTNTLQMLDGRKSSTNGQYAVPMMKILVDGDAVDNSVLPIANRTVLRPAPFVNFGARKVRDFTLQRGGGLGGETEWLINDLQFDPINPLATPRLNTFEAWGINNGGGGWTHPMHMHQEEHHVLMRSSAASLHPDDIGKEDTVALEPSEQSTIYRGFRTFLGNYVAHCHNLGHEDHNMMFGWTIVP
jgi:FtsP/CotA-like multicopper oxidase with cupredoxin domain